MISGMLMLLDFPEDVSKTILSEWIRPGELTRLDSAMACRQRGFFLWLLSILPDVIDLDSNGMIESKNATLRDMHTWFYKRRIHLRNLLIGAESFDDQHFAYQVTFAFIHHLYAHDDIRSEDLTVEIVNSCHSLKSLHCRIVSNAFLGRINTKTLEALNRLDLTILPSESGYMASLIPLHTHCRKLKSLKLNIDDGTVLPALKDIILFNRDLRSLELCADPTLLTFIIEECPKVEEVRVVVPLTRVSFDLLGSLIEHRARLRHLEAIDNLHGHVFALTYDHQSEATKRVDYQQYANNEDKNYLDSLVPHLTQLSHASFYHSVTDVTLAKVLSCSGPNLQLLSIPRTFGLSADALQQIMVQCPVLRELELFFLTAEQFDLLFSGPVPASLCKVTLGGRTVLSFAVVRKVIESCTGLRECKFLRVEKDPQLLEEFKAFMEGRDLRCELQFDATFLVLHGLSLEGL